ncbi:MAG: hypothetical protein WDN28_23530 [Chthoniobacter sp.]
MNYQFIVEQRSQEYHGWHFLVWIDEPVFRAECQRLGFSRDFAHPSWPYDEKTWENAIHEAAIDTVHDVIGVTTLASFGPGSTFSVSNAPGPFKNPTTRRIGFELLLLSR